MSKPSHAASPSASKVVSHRPARAHSSSRSRRAKKAVAPLRLSNRQYFPSAFPLWIAEIKQEALGEHSHEFFEMVYVRRGRGRHIIEGVAHPIQAGDLYVINPDEKHGYEPPGDDTLRLVNILWQPALVEDLLRAECHPLFNLHEGASDHSTDGAPLLYVEPLLRGETRFAHRLHLSGRNALRVEILIDEMRREQTAQAQGGQLLLRHLFCALLVLLSRAWSEQQQKTLENHQTPRGFSDAIAEQNKRSENATASGRGDVVARAVEYIEEHHARALRVADVAAHASISSSRLSHVFKAQLGRGVNEYLHEMRIARVCSALLESSTSVSDIASAVGYNDARFFHRVFRRHTGCNPTQYRQHFTTKKQ